MATKPVLTRRAFLKTGTLGLAGVSLLSACAPAAPATRPAETKPAEAAKPAAPAATATASGQAAPAAAAATSAPAAAAPAAKAEPKLGAQLIGKLEGPTVVTDAAQLPKAFKEAPAFAELVKTGKLPPVAERIGQDPLVIKPLHEIGKYGGIWRHGFTGPGDQWNGFRAASGPDHLLFWDYTGDKIVTNVARGYELQDGGKATVVQLRRGMKWSDGVPFTADDFMFAWEDLYQHKELYPSGSVLMSIDGKPGRIEKIDEFTVRYVFPEPYYLFPAMLAGSTAISAHSFQGDPSGVPTFAPAHYLKQFLPKHAGQAKVDELAKSNNFDNWVNMFKTGTSGSSIPTCRSSRPGRRSRRSILQPGCWSGTRTASGLTPTGISSRISTRSSFSSPRIWRCLTFGRLPASTTCSRDTLTWGSCPSSSRTSRRATTGSHWTRATMALTAA